MVSYDRSAVNATMEELDDGAKRAKFPFEGLSTDTKPTDEEDGVKIKNGSSFFELDTQDVKFYDEENGEWK